MPTKEDICNAAYEGDLGKLRQLALEGANFNEVDEHGKALLAEIVYELCQNDEPFRYEVVTLLLELGAEPNSSIDGTSLYSAVIPMDTRMLQILLEAGADPNKRVDSEYLYEWAEFDYRYELYDITLLPEEPTEEDKRDEDSWLAFLDRIAIKNNLRRPDHLFLLRSYGAKTWRELEKHR